MLTEVIRLLIYLRKPKRLGQVSFKTSSQPSERPREDLENAPRIIINTPSKNGINNKSQEQQIIISGNYNKKAEYLAFKLDNCEIKQAGMKVINCF